jgi:putative membrane-bound dehydrogenase-like protein
MTLLRRFLPALVLLAGLAPLRAAEPVVHPQPDARRLEVLFLGAPTANGPYHDPITRYRSLKKAVGTAGINLTYSESLDEAFDPAFLDRFDALLLYGNWRQRGTMDPAHERALLDFVENKGRGFLPIHCASACFGASEAFVRLVGGRFLRHGDGVFAPVTVRPDHPAIAGTTPVEAWDETYVHDRHNDDRLVLQVRKDPAGDEPWTWVRTQGRGRVFYTASGHDHRVWDEPAFQALLKSAIHWAVGSEAKARLDRLQLPVLAEQEVVLPGYKARRAITRAQLPLSPVESAKLIQVPPGFEVSLFAAEPDIVNPIYVAWDHRGRAFVVETVDYPNNLQTGNIGNDRITICEDTNGDGRADTFTVFADKLSIPTGLVFANGGVIITNGSQLLFLQDTNGDDRADVRKVLIDGFSMRDTHAGPSNLRYGFDNWIYATIGYSGFEGTVGDESHRFAQALFRFKPDGSRLEQLQSTTNNTWGLGFTEEFAILGSTANANPSWVYTFPRERYVAAGLNPPRTPRADDNPKFFPSSMDIRQVDVHDGYTAAAGHAFYTARRFPAAWQNRLAFITEPTGKLVGQFEVAPKGASYTARQLPNNLFNSADAWSSPVAAEVGPDGAVWICDWYNLIIQHNPTPSLASAGIDAENGPGNAYQTPLRDTRHGRIWRVYPRGTDNDLAPALDPARPATLVAALHHGNLLWRLHAQRLLVEGGHVSAEPALRQLVRDAGPASVHALQALAGLGRADAALLLSAADARNPALRRAVRDLASPAHPAAIRAQLASAEVAADPRERAEVLVAASRLATDAAFGATLFQFAVAREAEFAADPVFADAWQIAARANAPGVISAALAGNLAFEKPDQGVAAQVLPVLAWHTATGEARLAVAAEARRHDNAFARYVVSSLSEAPAAAGVVRRFTPDPIIHRRGAEIYANTCVACHGLDGQGVAGAFPPLAGSARLTGDPSIPARIVMHGLAGPLEVNGTRYDSIMPPVVGLSDGDIASVLTYVRQAFGNDAAAVEEAEVRTVRQRTRGRRDMWKAEELVPLEPRR